ncbi:MAG: hypothetical protein ACRDQ7_18175 [Haloechinothrix sp.]
MTSTVTRSGPETGSAGAQGEHVPDGNPHGRRPGLGDLLDLPGQAYRSVVRSARTTPGRLSIILAGLVALSLLAGLAGTIMAQSKRDTLTDLIEHREPLAAAAQQVYRALSDADATASSAFLSAGSEPPALRQRYENDLAQAGASLAKAASDAANVPQAAEQVDIISQRLPVYAGLVETARANNRLGYPVGASYLREASHLMRSTILPAARDLYVIDTERLAAEQDDATDFPWLTTLLVLGLLAALIATQRYLQRTTNRVFNIGLVVATGAVVLGLLWSSVALIVQSVLVNSAEDDGTAQVDLLVRSRIAALQARTDETLTLVARGDDSGSYEEEFATLSERLAGTDGRGGMLREASELAGDGPAAEHIDAARANAVAWLAAHAEVRKHNEDGEYKEAVEQAIDGEREGGSAASFLRLDGDLRSAIAVGRQSFFDDTTNANRALTLVPAGLALLGIVAALGVTVGIQERLREYR